MTNVQKDISKYNLIKQIGSDYVTYLFKLKDGRLCVCCRKEMKIFNIQIIHLLNSCQFQV